jgi:hypothetical protein
MDRRRETEAIPGTPVHGTICMMTPCMFVRSVPCVRPGASERAQRRSPYRPRGEIDTLPSCAARSGPEQVVARIERGTT